MNVSPKSREFEKIQTKSDTLNADAIQLGLIMDNNASSGQKQQASDLLKTEAAPGNANNNRNHTRRACQNCNDEECKLSRKTFKRPLPCLFAWTLLISATGSYFMFCAPELERIIDDFFYWLMIMVVQCLIFVYVIVNFLIATLRDPGRFPKYIIASDDPNFNDDTKSPLYKTITIKKAQVKIKWCSVSFLLFYFWMLFIKYFLSVNNFFLVFFLSLFKFKIMQIRNQLSIKLKSFIFTLIIW